MKYNLQDLVTNFRLQCFISRQLLTSPLHIWTQLSERSPPHIFPKQACYFRLMWDKDVKDIRRREQTERETGIERKSCVSVFCLQKTCSSLPGFTYFLTLLLCNATLSVFLVPEPNQTAAETKKRMENSEWNYLEMMVDDISEAKTNTSCKTMKPCGVHMAFVCL